MNRSLGTSLWATDNDRLPAGDVLHRFSHKAMATSFEILCIHGDRAYAQQAAWKAFDLLDRLEQDLSRFIENSDISRINCLATGETSRVNRGTMECLLLARLAYTETGGAFDISLGTGLFDLELVPHEFVVRSRGEGVRLDLGGIGKGYAVDRMAEVLLDWEIRQALIHGGFSSVRALDAPPDLAGWPLTMSMPAGEESESFALFHAKRCVLSASGLRKGDHILNPRGHQAGDRRLASWVAAGADAMMPFCRRAGTAGASESAVESPAAVAEVLSTAFMILDLDEVLDCTRRHTGLESWLIEQRSGGGGRGSVIHLP